jgi:hypothetical protein
LLSAWSLSINIALKAKVKHNHYRPCRPRGV